MLRVFLMLAAFFGFTGVALGAFAAHGLKGRLTEQYLAIFHTGVTYQLVHALALIGVALLATQLQSRLVTWAGICFALGIVLKGQLALGMLLAVQIAAGVLAFVVMIVLSRHSLVVEVKRQFCRSEKMKMLLRAG